MGGGGGTFSNVALLILVVFALLLLAAVAVWEFFDSFRSGKRHNATRHNRDGLERLYSTPATTNCPHEERSA